MSQAVRWAKQHGYRTGLDAEDIDRIESQWRFQQFEPSLCSAQGGTKEITDGVSLFVCKLKQPEVEDSEVKEQKRQKADYISLSSIINLAASEGGIIKNQIVLHTGEWRGGDVTITRDAIDGMVNNWKVLSDKTTPPYS